VEQRLAMSNENNPPNKTDRYLEKLKFYEGLNIMAEKISPTNSALVWVNALAVLGICILAKLSAPWYVFVILGLLGITSMLAVRRDKHAKGSNSSTHQDSS
jgi:hypothetical protein